MSYEVTLNALGTSYSIPEAGQTNYANDLSLYLRDLATVVNDSSGGGTVGAIFNVRTYGATGNGATNDTTAINLAISALVASSSTSGSLYFPAGTYVTSSTLALTTNVVVLGDGAASIIKPTGAFSTTPVLSFTGSPYWAVSNLTIDASARTGTGDNILATNSSNGVVTGVTNKNSAQYGLNVAGTSANCVAFNNYYTSNAADNTHQTAGNFNNLLTNTSGGIRGREYYSVKDFGAVGNATIDDTVAIQAAYTAARATGGTVFFPTGKYRVTDRIVNGYYFVAESDITVLTPDYPAAASFDAVNFALAQACPRVNTAGEAGTYLWGDFTGNKAILYNGIASTQPATNVSYKDLILVGQPGMALGGTILTPSTAVTPATTQVGFFAAGAKLELNNLAVYVINRGFVVCSCYWSCIDTLEVYHCDRGAVLTGMNATDTSNITVSYAFTGGVELLGQGFEVTGLYTEQCVRSLYVPQADGGKISDTYWEAVGAGYNGYQVVIGNGALNVVELHIENSHLSTQFGKSCLLTGSALCLVSIGEGTHWYPDAAHGIQVTDSQCALWVEPNTVLQVDPAGTGSVYYLTENLKVNGIRLLGPRDLTHTGLSGIQLGRAGLFCSSSNLFGIVQDNNDTPLFQVETFSGRIINSGAIDSGYAATTLTSLTLDENYHYVAFDAGSGTVTVTLPAASTCKGREYAIKKTDGSANAIVITAAGADTIDGSATLSVANLGGSVRIVSNGSNGWKRFAGDTVLAAAVGASPSAAAATLSGQTLTLQPADATHPGVVTSGTQVIGGAKEFAATITADAPFLGQGVRLAGPRDLTNAGLSGVVFGRAGLACDPATNVVGLYQDNSATQSMGLETFSGRVIYGSNNNIVSHAGGGQGSATALLGQVNYVTTVATADDSVVLPTAVYAGMKLTLFNLGANQLAVFPASGGTIDALGANTAYTLAAGSSKDFHAQTATQWRSK